MKILLADDHGLIRKGLHEIIARMHPGFEIIEAGSHPEIHDCLVAQSDIELLLLDLYLPGADGMQGLKRIRHAFPEVAVVMISSEEQPDVVREAIACGASGYIPKSTGNDVMQRALDLVMAGGIYVPPLILQSWPDDNTSVVSEATSVHNSARPNVLLADLSSVQRDIAALVGQGLSNKEIAERTGFALQTVKNHVSRILRITRLSNRAALAARLAGQG